MFVHTFICFVQTLNFDSIRSHTTALSTPRTQDSSRGIRDFTMTSKATYSSLVDETSTVNPSEATWAIRSSQNVFQASDRLFTVVRDSSFQICDWWWDAVYCNKYGCLCQKLFRLEYAGCVLSMPPRSQTEFKKIKYPIFYVNLGDKTQNKKYC